MMMVALWFKKGDDGTLDDGFDYNGGDSVGDGGDVDDDQLSPGVGMLGSSEYWERHCRTVPGIGHHHIGDDDDYEIYDDDENGHRHTSDDADDDGIAIYSSRHWPS